MIVFTNTVVVSTIRFVALHPIPLENMQNALCRKGLNNKDEPFIIRGYTGPAIQPFMAGYRIGLVSRFRSALYGYVSAGAAFSGR